MPDVRIVPPTGPCAVLGAKDEPSECCARSHADAAAAASRLSTPYIFNCHMRLVAWAVPVLTRQQSFPLTIICGGVLVSKPDSALRAFARDVAPRHGVEPAILIDSFDSVPVLSRKHVRATAEFLFQMTNTFLAEALQQNVGERRPERRLVVNPRQSLIFPPIKTQETQRAKARRLRELTQESSEAEIVRFLRQREPGRALEALMALMARENLNNPNAMVTKNLRPVEIFSRLFRELAGRGDVSLTASYEFSRLVSDVLSGNKPGNPANKFEEACQRFIQIASELVQTPRSRKARAIENYVRLNLAKKLTLETVSARFDIAERQLNSVAQKYYGMNFAEYVSVMRVAEAKRLLQETSLAIGAIANRTGFRDQSYFTKVFKSRLGLTPSELRDMRA